MDTAVTERMVFIVYGKCMYRLCKLKESGKAQLRRPEKPQLRKAVKRRTEKFCLWNFFRETDCAPKDIMQSKYSYGDLKG